MRKTILSFAIFWITVVNGKSQCTVYAAINQLPVDCADDSITFGGATTTNCAFGGYYSFEWTALSAVDSIGDSDTLATLSGVSYTSNNLQSFSIALDDVLPAEVCLQVVYIDASGQPLDTVNQCLNTINFSQPITVTGYVSANSCGDPSCLAQYTASGGTAPYSYLLSDGSVIAPGTVTCFNASGTYILTAIDANGCNGEFIFNIIVAEDDNSTCANAIDLELNAYVVDTLCSLSFDSSVCGNFGYYQHGWYQFNSQEFDYISIGADIGYGAASGGNFMQPFLIEVYENSGSNICGGDLVHCHLSDSSGGCFALNESITLLPNTNYSLHVLAQWTSWVPLTLLVSADTAAQDVICGCTNSMSCNYDPGSMINDGSCGYNGCMDVSACNYLAYADCDDGSCVYGSDLSAIVFHDLNGDGVYQSYNPGEPLIGATGFFTIVETGQNVFPSAQGEILIPNLPSGVYSISYTDSSNSWILPGGIITTQLPSCSTLSLGLVPLSGATAQVDALGSFWGQTFHCVGGINPGISIHNTGISAITGTITLTYDSSLSYASIGGADFVELSPGTILWTINNQPAGSSEWYDLHINGPGSIYAGMSFPFSFSIQLQDANGQIFYSNSWSYSAWVTCSYDPNDKVANPIGYTNNHFISADQVLEYKIRFQNTGNATAFNVRIDDQLDTVHLNLSTFQLTGSSHDYFAVMNPNGLLQLYFNDIMLPDSLTDEPNSHGWIQYRIAPLTNLVPGDVISNTASIYFDDNLPVLTNEVTHTVYDCSLMEPLDDSVVTCIANPVILSVDTTFTSLFTWYDNGVQASTGAEFNYAFPEIGLHVLVLERSNPLCNRIDTIWVQSNPFPSSELISLGNTIYASEGDYWEWYFNDDLIADSTQSIVATETGVYYAYIYSAEGCMTISEVFVVTEVTDVARQMMTFFPNPSEGVFRINGLMGTETIELYDALVRVVSTETASGEMHLANYSMLTSGAYTLKVIGETIHTERIIIR